MASDITVLVGPTGHAGEQVRSVLARLTDLGVLTRASHLFWVDVSDERRHLGDEGWSVVDGIQDELALLRCESARFIAIDLASGSLAAGEGRFDHGTAVAATAELQFPPGLVAERNRLVVPLHAGDRFDPAVLRGWSTIVAVPENRFSDRHPPASLGLGDGDEPGDYFGHVAAHVATVAGLWRNDTADLFGDMAQPISDQMAIAQRVFSRSVVGIDVADEIVEPLLDQSAGHWSIPRNADSGIGVVAHPAPHELVNVAVRNLGQVEGFRYRRPASYSSPSASRISVADAFRLFFARLRLAATDAPSVLSSQVKDRLERTSHQLTTAITGIGHEGSSVRFSADSVAAGEHGSPADMLERIGAPVFVQATPAAWRTLRSMCFGLIDGDAHSVADEVATVEERRTVVTDPGLIAPSPDSGLEIDDADDGWIASTDVRRYREAVAYEEAHLDTLTAWRAEGQRQQSLLWQLGAGLTSEYEKSSSDVAEALTVLATSPDDAGVTMSARQRLGQLRTMARIGGFFCLLALTYAVVETARDLGSGAFYITTSLGSITLATWLTLASILAFVLGTIWYIREELRLRFQVDEHYRRMQWAQAALPQALTEMHRLSVVYEQFLDWSNVISTVVHRPWGASDLLKFQQVRPTFAPGELPHSLAVVSGQGHPSHDSNLRVGLEAELVRVGWLGRNYEEVSQALLAQYAREHRRPNDDRLDPDEDVPTAPIGTRAYLVDHLTSGRGQELARRRARSRAIDYLLNLDPSDTLPKLDAGWHPESLIDGLSTTELLRELGDASQMPLDQAIFTPGGQQRGAREVATRASFVPAPLRETSDRVVAERMATDFTLVSARVELSAPTPMADFALFELPGGDEARSRAVARKQGTDRPRPRAHKKEVEEPLI